MNTMIETKPKTAKHIDQESTRYICAGAFLNFPFRYMIVDWLRKTQYTAASPPTGVHTRAVAIAAAAARQRSLVLSIAYTVMLLLAFTGILAPVSLLLAWGLGIWDRWYVRHRIVAKAFSRASFDAESFVAGRQLSPRSEQRVRAIESVDHGNLIVYRGYSPFAGAGVIVNGRSFVIDPEKPREGVDHPQPIDLLELRSRIQKQFERLSLPGSEINCYTVVGGDRLDAINRKPTGRDLSIPSALEEGEVDAARHRHDEDVREYLACRVTMWGGELVLTRYVRFRRLNQCLFTEDQTCVLPPVREDFKLADSLTVRPTIWQWLRLIGAGVLQGTFMLFLAPLFLSLRLQMRIYRLISDWDARAVARQNVAFDHGAHQSIREMAADTRYTKYFQKTDVDMIVKLIDRAVYDAVIEYLEEHDIDTSELKDRATTIYNEGIMITGGSRVEGSSLAAGRRNVAKTAIQAVKRQRRRNKVGAHN